MSSRLIQETTDEGLSVEGVGEGIFQGDICIDSAGDSHVRLETYRYLEDDENNNGLHLTPDEARMIAINLVKMARLVESRGR